MIFGGICDEHGEHAPGGICLACERAEDYQPPALCMCLACSDTKPEKCLIRVPVPSVPR